MSNPIAGWYPDPSGDQSRLRYWDGASWTEHYAPAQGGAQPTAQAAGPDGASTAAGQSAGSEAPAEGTGSEAAAGEDGPEATQQAHQAGQQHQQPQYSQQHQQHQYSQQQHGQHQHGQQQHGQQQHAPYGQQQPQQMPAYQQAQHAPAHQQSQQGYGQHQYAPQAAYAQQGGEQPYGQYPGSQPYNQSPYATPTQPQDPYAQPQPSKEGGGSGKGLVVGIIVAAVVLIAAAVIAVVLLFRGGDEPEPARPQPTGTVPSPAQTDPPTDRQTDAPSTPAIDAVVDGGELDLDTTVAGRFDVGQSWSATVSVTQAAPVVFDVVATEGDLMLAVTGGSVDVENDDRRNFLDVDAVSPLDPALAVHLEPGEYEVTVSSYRDASAGDFELTTRVVDMVAPGDTVSVTAGEDEFWAAAFELSEDSTVVFDTVSSEGDAVLGLFTATGDSDRVDDSDEGAGAYRDPYLRTELPAGVHFIGLHDYWGDALETELTISVE